MRAGLLAVAVLVAGTAAAHVPTRCDSLTQDLERESLARGAILGEIAQADIEDEVAVLNRVVDLLDKDRRFADALNRWILCVAEIE